MLTNRLNPLVCFGILILAIPMFLLGVVLEELIDNNFIINPIEIWHIEVLTAIVFAFVTSFSLMLRWKYAKLLTNILMIFIALIFGIFMAAEIKGFNGRSVVPIAISSFIYLAILFCMLFINSEFLRPFFDREVFVKGLEEEVEDILDV